MPTNEWSRAAGAVRGSNGAGNGTTLGLGRLVRVGEHPWENKSSWEVYTVGAGVAPLGDDLLKFLA